MKIAIRYYTKTGNTEKLARAIEEVTNVEAKDIFQKLDDDVDILFLGSSVYAAGVDDEVKKFISNIDVKDYEPLEVTEGPEPITYDDVIDAHRFIKELEGDWNKYLSK